MGKIMVNIIYLMKNKYRNNMNKSLKTLFSSKYYVTDIILKMKDVNLFIKYVELYLLKNTRGIRITYQIEKKDIDSNSYMYISSFKNNCIVVSYLNLDIKEVNKNNVLLIDEKYVETMRYCLERGKC